MDALEELIRSLRHSPHLPMLVDRLSEQLAEERLARERFYKEMTPDQKIEFIAGEVILHSPARNRHLDVTGYVFKLIHTFVELHSLGTVKSEKCLCVFPRNDYEPDVVFFGTQKMAKLKPDTLKFPVPDLAVEVLSESTGGRDRGVKYDDFAVNGVGEYWIVDADKDTVEQFVLIGSQYELRMKASTGQLRSQVVSSFAIDIPAMFDGQQNLDALRSMLT